MTKGNEEMENYRMALAYISKQSTDQQSRELAETALNAFPAGRVPQSPLDTLTAREVIARAMYLRHKGSKPDWPIGLDKLGYNQEPYIREIPAWEWFYGGDADAILAALSLTRPLRQGENK